MRDTLAAGLALILAARLYFVQELLALLVMSSSVSAMLLLLVALPLVSLDLIDREMDFLKPRLRALVTPALIMLSELFYRLGIIAELRPFHQCPFWSSNYKERSGAGCGLIELTWLLSAEERVPGANKL